MLCEMDCKVEIKEEPVWPEGTGNSFLDGYVSNVAVNDSIVNVESQTTVIPKVEKDALGPSTEDVTPVENFEFVSGMIPLKQETKSELTEPRPTEENAFEPSADVKDEIIIEEHTVDQQLPFIKEESNLENVAVLTKGLVHSCDVCCRVFSGKNLLKRHMLSHSGERPYHCTVCSETFSNMDDFQKHIYSHSNKPPYCCTMCMKLFTRKDTLKLHLPTHSAERPHTCHVCQVTFSLKSYLNKHMLSHSGKRPYRCTVCRRRFADECALNNHLLTHSGDRQYRCTECQSTFFSKYHLKRHLNTVKCGTLYVWCI